MMNNSVVRNKRGMLIVFLTVVAIIIGGVSYTQSTTVPELNPEYIGHYRMANLIDTVPEVEREQLEEMNIDFVVNCNILTHTYEGSDGHYMYDIDLTKGTMEIQKNKDGGNKSINDFFDEMVKQ